MSASKHVTIWCDVNADDAPYPYCRHHIEVGETDSINVARRNIKTAGWRRVKGQDVCWCCLQAPSFAPSLNGRPHPQREGSGDAGAPRGTQGRAGQ